MSEAKEGCAWLEDVDQHTFVRFSQYAYTGDYLPAEPEILLDSSMIETTHSVPGNATSTPDQDHNSQVLPPTPNDYETSELHNETIVSEPDPPLAGFEPVMELRITRFPKQSKKGKKKTGLYSYGEQQKEEAYAYDSEALEREVPQSKKSKLWEGFNDRVYVRPQPDFQPRRNRESCEDYTEVFLSHARLYVFAETYDIGPLKLLSIHKLQRTLTSFTLYRRRIGDIVDLMRYTYLNTADLSESADSLRVLVIHYAACFVEELAQSAQFQSLLEEVGQLARDLVGQMLKRLD